MSKASITKILILLTGVVWIAWDIYVYNSVGNPATESATVWRYSYYFPGVAFLAGVLCGHFFFQMRGPIDWAKDLDAPTKVVPEIKT